MELRMKLLTMITLTGMVMTSGVGQASDQPKAGMKGSRGPEGTATTVVNQDQVAGKWKQFKGELKKTWGEFTDDDLLAIEGKVDKLEGKIQERYGDRREEVKQWVDEWFELNKNPKEAS